jgi:hypothetical protein
MKIKIIASTCALILAFCGIYYVHQMRKVKIDPDETLYNAKEREILVQKVLNKHKKWSLVDIDSTAIELGEFDEIFFPENSDISINNFITKRKNIFTYYNIKSLKPVKQLDCTEVRYFDKNIAFVVGHNGNYGIINSTNSNWIIFPSISYYSDFNKSTILSIDGYFGMINEKGDIIAHFEYLSIANNDNNSLAIFNKNGQLGLMNDQGREISNFGRIQNIEPISNGFILNSNGFKGLAGVDGTQLLSIDYESISENSNVFNLYKNGNWGIFDPQNNVLIPCIYEEIKPTDEGYIVKKYGAWGFLNKRNEVKIDTKYKSLTIETLSPYAKVKNYDDLYGWINYTNGETIINPQYDYVWDEFSNEYSQVRVRKNGNTIKIRPDGRIVNTRSALEIIKDIIN